MIFLSSRECEPHFTDEETDGLINPLQAAHLKLEPDAKPKGFSPLLLCHAFSSSAHVHRLQCAQSSCHELSLALLVTGIRSVRPQLEHPKCFRFFFSVYGSQCHHHVAYKCPPMHTRVIVTNQSCADKSLITNSQRVAKPKCKAFDN